MRHLLFCISGFSGVGKDEFAKRLINNHSAIQTGLVDPAKRHMADLYGFSEKQLFGPSRNRNAGDIRYPKPEFPSDAVRTEAFGPVAWSDEPASMWTSILGPDSTFFEGDPKYWLSPREALQRYCELMNLMYGDTWIKKGLETHIDLATKRYSYSRMQGLTLSAKQAPDPIVTVFTDFRHKHEFRAARELRSPERSVIFIRIKHPKIQHPPFNHRSEVEQTQIPDSDFDFVVLNDGTIEDLHRKADEIVATFTREGK